MGRRGRWVLPALAGAVALGAGAAVACGSGSDGAATTTADVSRSSTVALDAADRLWLTSPDDDAVVALDPDSLEVVRTVAVGGRPEQLTVVDGRVLVTQAGGTDLSMLGTDAAPGEPTAIALPCGGSRAVAALDEAVAVVTCPTDDRLAVVDLAAAATAGWIEVPGRPTGLLVADGEVLVTTAGDGRLHRLDAEAVADASAGGDGGRLDVAVEAEGEAWADGERTASQLGPLDLLDGEPVGTYQVVDNVRQLSSRQIAGDATYGTPLNGRARLEPALLGPCGARFAAFDEPGRLLSGPVALAASPAGDGLVWVVGQYSHSVSVVRCDGGGPASRSTTVASFPVGAGARGIAVSADGRRAWVDVGFDHEVARLELPDGVDGVAATDEVARTEPDAVGRREVGDQHLSPLAQEGRRMFADATDTHLTPFGVVSCASCHPDAGDDGLSWRIETADLDAKLRRTPPVWQVDAEAKPLHWDGAFDSTDELTLETIQELLGGDGLLVDTAAITAYLAEAPAPPARPVDDAGADPVARGEELFAASGLGCATCHRGDAGTDGATHDVLDEVASRPAQLDAVVTPSLTGTRGRAPYGHDGRAPTLAELLAEHRDAAGDPFDLSDEDLAAIATYLTTR
ncbi:MAG: c-type cytochrome [Acidimicrobiales bacterium]|nr:c-type cytochrome [Acidimicrobiales bacterium]